MPAMKHLTKRQKKRKASGGGKEGKRARNKKRGGKKKASVQKKPAANANANANAPAAPAAPSAPAAVEKKPCQAVSPIPSSVFSIPDLREETVPSSPSIPLSEDQRNNIRIAAIFFEDLDSDDEEEDLDSDDEEEDLDSDDDEDIDSDDEEDNSEPGNTDLVLGQLIYFGNFLITHLAYKKAKIRCLERMEIRRLKMISLGIVLAFAVPVMSEMGVATAYDLTELIIQAAVLGSEAARASDLPGISFQPAAYQAPEEEASSSQQAAPEAPPPPRALTLGPPMLDLGPLTRDWVCNGCNHWRHPSEKRSHKPCFSHIDEAAGSETSKTSADSKLKPIGYEMLLAKQQKRAQELKQQQQQQNYVQQVVFVEHNMGMGNVAAVNQNAAAVDLTPAEVVAIDQIALMLTALNMNDVIPDGVQLNSEQLAAIDQIALQLATMQLNEGIPDDPAIDFEAELAAMTSGLDLNDWAYNPAAPDSLVRSIRCILGENPEPTGFWGPRTIWSRDNYLAQPQPQRSSPPLSGSEIRAQMDRALAQVPAEMPLPAVAAAADRPNFQYIMPEQPTHHQSLQFPRPEQGSQQEPVQNGVLPTAGQRRLLPPGFRGPRYYRQGRGRGVQTGPLNPNTVEYNPNFQNSEYLYNHELQQQLLQHQQQLHHQFYEQQDLQQYLDRQKVLQNQLQEQLQRQQQFLQQQHQQLQHQRHLNNVEHEHRRQQQQQHQQQQQQQQHQNHQQQHQNHQQQQVWQQPYWQQQQQFQQQQNQQQAMQNYNPNLMPPNGMQAPGGEQRFHGNSYGRNPNAAPMPPNGMQAPGGEQRFHGNTYDRNQNAPMGYPFNTGPSSYPGHQSMPDRMSQQPMYPTGPSTSASAMARMNAQQMQLQQQNGDRPSELSGFVPSAEWYRGGAAPRMPHYRGTAPYRAYAYTRTPSQWGGPNDTIPNESPETKDFNLSEANFPPLPNRSGKKS